jgi:hypothetical protein
MGRRERLGREGRGREREGGRNRERNRERNIYTYIDLAGELARAHR